MTRKTVTQQVQGFDAEEVQKFIERGQSVDSLLSGDIVAPQLQTRTMSVKSRSNFAKALSPLGLPGLTAGGAIDYFNKYDFNNPGAGQGLIGAENQTLLDDLVSLYTQRTNEVRSRRGAPGVQNQTSTNILGV